MLVYLLRIGPRIFVNSDDVKICSSIPLDIF